ncbi:MAG TPA: ATP-binding protein [Pyrinomonadaceae bacterium]
MEFQDNVQKRARLREGFSPGVPIDRYELFAGRLEQARDVYDAAVTPGRHVLLYGERGVGKTSMAKVLHEFLEASGIHGLTVKTINCDRTDDYSTLWQKAFREMVSDGQEKDGLLDAVLDKDVIAPDDVRFVLSRLGGSRIVIFDEFDKLYDEEGRILFADTIKNLADHAVETTLMLVGVADTVEELIKEHKSIERSLVQVRMPRMARGELAEIVDRGMTKAGMAIEDRAKDLIVLLSQGLPFYTHYFGMYSGFKALDHNRTVIEMPDVADSTVGIIGKAHHVRSAYVTAVSSSQKSIYPQVLLACALTETDELGFFNASDVSKPLSELTGKRYGVEFYTRHLKAFCEADRGRILVKVGPPFRIRYRFADALMQPYVIIDGLAKGILPLDLILNRTRDAASSVH